MIEKSSMPLITLSIVSHGQAALVHELLDDIQRVIDTKLEVILTLNIPEDLPFDVQGFSFPIRMLRNDFRKGFGANHNAAFAVSSGQYFCVLNPDIRFAVNPLPELLNCLKDPHVAIAAPLVVNMAGGVEDSARRFPSPFQIMAKILGRKHRPDYAVGTENISPDWVGGMCMLIPASVYRSIGGFDERYFLYYEDVDLCARLRLSGHDIRLCPKAKVVHEARRQSHRDWKYRRWHIASILRFFTSPVYFSLLWSRWAMKIATRPGDGRR